MHKDTRKRLEKALAAASVANAKTISLHTSEMLLQARVASLQTELLEEKERTKRKSQALTRLETEHDDEVSRLKSKHTFKMELMHKKIDDNLELLRMRDATIAAHAGGAGNNLSGAVAGVAYYINIGGVGASGPHSAHVQQ